MESGRALLYANLLTIIRSRDRAALTAWVNGLSREDFVLAGRLLGALYLEMSNSLSSTFGIQFRDRTHLEELADYLDGYTPDIDFAK